MDIYRELNVELPKDIESVKESVHRFAKDVLRPAAAVLDRMTDPRDVIALDSPLRSVLKQAYQLGYHVAGLPTEIGGMGLRGLGMHVLIEEMSWGAVDLAISLLATGFPFSAAAASGNPELYEKFVKPYIADRDGSLIGCWAITEPQHGSDELVPGTPQFHNPRVTGQVVARADGDSYVINGQKAAWVSNGTIPRKWMLTKSEGYELEVERTLTFANSAMAAAFTGVARAAYEEALDYSKQRVQGGQPICEHQLVQKHLFEMFTKVEACRALSRAVMIYNQTSAAPSLEHAIAAKTFCTQASFEVASDALQVFGGNGLSKEYGIEKLFRDARASLIEDGTNDVLSLAGARHILDRNGVAGPATAQ